jgi:peroxiredoxin
MFTSAFAQIKESSDSLASSLDRHISAYISTIPLHKDSLINASEKLIDAGNKNNLSSYIAGRLFTIFRDSKIMGLEGVAIHIAEKYFLNGALIPPQGLSLLDIQVYTEFNRNSLIGMQAPDLEMSDINGNKVSLRDNLGSRYTVLLFFDDKCPVCMAEMPELFKLSDSLKTEGLNVFAVYVNPDESSMLKYINEKFKELPDNWIFASDPSYSTDFQRLYNVINTPRILLIDESGKIAGRDLSSKALKELIEKLNERKRELDNQIKGFAAAYLEAADYKDSSSVDDSFRSLFERVAGHEDKEIYRALFSFIFEELLYSEEYKRREASAIIAEKFIIPYSHFWESPSYPSEWVPSMVKRIKANKIGEQFPVLNLYNSKGRVVTLGETTTKYTLIYFTDPGCVACKLYTEVLKSNYKFLKRAGVKITAVIPIGRRSELKSYKRDNNLKWEVLSPDDDEVASIFKIYEAERVPSAVLLDERGRIIAKTLDFATIKDIIK